MPRHMVEVRSLPDAALEFLLAGDNPILDILREQVRSAFQTTQFTGAGFIIDFHVPEEFARLPGNVTFQFGDVVARTVDEKQTLGFVLFIEHGVVRMWEGYTFGEELWPDIQLKVSLRYDPSPRDLAWTREWMDKG